VGSVANGLSRAYCDGGMQESWLGTRAKRGSLRTTDRPFFGEELAGFVALFRQAIAQRTAVRARAWDRSKFALGRERPPRESHRAARGEFRTFCVQGFPSDGPRVCMG
jgi:hypothetical protein